MPINANIWQNIILKLHITFNLQVILLRANKLSVTEASNPDISNGLLQLGGYSTIWTHSYYGTMLHKIQNLNPSKVEQVLYAMDTPFKLDTVKFVCKNMSPLVPQTVLNIFVSVDSEELHWQGNWGFLVSSIKFCKVVWEEVRWLTLCWTHGQDKNNLSLYQTVVQHKKVFNENGSDPFLAPYSIMVPLKNQSKLSF